MARCGSRATAYDAVVRIAVNHLRFKEPLTEAVIAAANEGARLLGDAGGLSFSLVHVDERHAILVLAFPDLETEERISSEIGGPWMREHILPSLETSPERSSGEVVADSSRSTGQ